LSDTGEIARDDQGQSGVDQVFVFDLPYAELRRGGLRHHDDARRLRLTPLLGLWPPRREQGREIRLRAAAHARRLLECNVEDRPTVALVNAVRGAPPDPDEWCGLGTQVRAD